MALSNELVESYTKFTGLELIRRYYDKSFSEQDFKTMLSKPHNVIVPLTSGPAIGLYADLFSRRADDAKKISQDLMHNFNEKINSQEFNADVHNKKKQFEEELEQLSNELSRLKQLKQDLVNEHIDSAKEMYQKWKQADDE